MKKSILNLKNVNVLTKNEQKTIKGKANSSVTYTTCQNGQIVSTTITYIDKDGNGKLSGGDTIVKVSSIVIGVSDQSSPDEIGGC